MENKGKGEGSREGGRGEVGTGKGTGKSMRTCLSKLSVGNLPYYAPGGFVKTFPTLENSDSGIRRGLYSSHYLYCPNQQLV